jgi:hypothetical protein
MTGKTYNGESPSSQKNAGLFYCEISQENAISEMKIKIMQYFQYIFTIFPCPHS